MGPSKAGDYLGIPLEWAFDEPEGKSAVFIIRLELTHYFDGDYWTPLNDVSITGWFYPIRKDESRNETTCNMLMCALGWDGASVMTLHRGNYADKRVQCQVRPDVYMGRTSLKCKWLNPADYVPKGLTKPGDEKLNALASKYDKALQSAPMTTPSGVNAGGGESKAPANAGGRGTRPLPPGVVLAAPLKYAPEMGVPDESLEPPPSNIPF